MMAIMDRSYECNIIYNARPYNQHVRHLLLFFLSVHDYLRRFGCRQDFVVVDLIHIGHTLDSLWKNANPSS